MARYNWLVDVQPAHARYTRVGDVPARVQFLPIAKARGLLGGFR